jgi:outer membrane protein, heavy metal efflux system
MNMNKILSFIVILFLCQSLFAQNSLDNYLLVAARNNPGLQAKFKEYMAAMERVPQVGSLPDPTVAFGYFISPVETRVGPQNFKASISQVFPWFGLLNKREDVATEIAKAKYESFEEYKSRLFYEVRSAYYNYYFIDKAIDITQENIDILKTFLELAIIKFESGKVSAVDQLRVAMDIADLENDLAFLNDTKYEISIQFNNLLDVADQNQIIIPTILWKDTILIDRNHLMDSISVDNHQIKQIEHRILSWESQEVVAKKMGLPNFIIGFDYSAIGKSTNPAIEPGQSGKDAILFPIVGVTIPLYRKKYKAMIKEASFQLESETLQKTDKINQLSTLFEKGFKEYLDGKRRIELYLDQLLLAQQALDILLAQYSTDNQDFEEVLRMERKVLKYELELDKARADNNAAIAFITYLMGN